MTAISIPANAKATALIETNKPPRGATHFRYAEGKRKPIIDAIKNIDCLAGCTGKIEFGKVTYEGRGRHAKIKEFIPLADAHPKVTIYEANRPPEVIPPVDSDGDAKPGSKGRKNKIHGHSACAVAKALGKLGVKWEEADRIMRAHGIEMPKASLSVQLGFGRNQATWEKRGEPAPITDEQIADLRNEVASA